MSLRFGLQLPIQAQSKLMADPWESAAGPEELGAVAVAADRAGFDYVSVCDHVAIPPDAATRMTTTWYDTVATLAWLAARTDRVRLAATVYILSYRNPLLTSKAFSTLDALSGGRAVLGVGAGHLQPEFAALGVPYEERGRLTDEAIVAVRAAFADEWGAEGLGQSPRPVQPGGPPIWVGGSSPRARRRAAELGDGWLPQGPMDDLAGAIAGIHERRRAAARSGDFAVGAMVRVHMGTPGDAAPGALAGDAAAIAEQLAVYADAGVTHPQVKFPTRSCSELVDQLAAFGAEVIPLLQ